MFKSGLLLFFLVLTGTVATGHEQSISGVVVEVVDGDTVYLQESSGTRTRVRLHDIDAPEVLKTSRSTGRVKSESQPYGEEARQALAAKVGGKLVRAEVLDSGLKGVIATVWLNDRNINLEMVREGSAWVAPGHLNHKPSAEYLQAEEYARKGRQGLWQQKNPQPPWEFKAVQRMKLNLMEFWLF